MSDETKYVLDGIQTAMTAVPQTAGEYSIGERIDCPCGWQLWPGTVNGSWTNDDRAALRFHFTHCAHARGEVMYFKTEFTTPENRP
jgi:hypothetical protein